MMPLEKLSFSQQNLRSGQGLYLSATEKSGITVYISNTCQEELVTICEVARDTVMAMKRSAMPLEKFVFPNYISE